MKVIELDTSIYALEAIERAIYDLSAESLLIIEKSNYTYRILSQHNFNQELFNKFMQLLTDHQIRIQLDSQFFELRQLIVYKAINPSN